MPTLNPGPAPKTLGTLLEVALPGCVLRRGDVAYLRLGLDGFTTIDGRTYAMLTPIDREMNALSDATVWADPAWLVDGKTTVEEVRAHEALRSPAPGG